jgi:hypothetical protein
LAERRQSPWSSHTWQGSGTVYNVDMPSKIDTSAEMNFSSILHQHIFLDMSH